MEIYTSAVFQLMEIYTSALFQLMEKYTSAFFRLMEKKATARPTLKKVAGEDRPRGLKRKVFRIGLKICAYTNFGSLTPNMCLLFAYVL